MTYLGLDNFLKDKIKNSLRDFLDPNIEEYLKKRILDGQMRKIMKHYFKYQNTFNILYMLDFFESSQDFKELKKNIKDQNYDGDDNKVFFKFKKKDLKYLFGSGTKAFFINLVNRRESELLKNIQAPYEEILVKFVENFSEEIREKITEEADRKIESERAKIEEIARKNAKAELEEILKNVG